MLCPLLLFLPPSLPSYLLPLAYSYFSSLFYPTLPFSTLPFPFLPFIFLTHPFHFLHFSPFHHFPSLSSLFYPTLPFLPFISLPPLLLPPYPYLPSLFSFLFPYLPFPPSPPSFSLTSCCRLSAGLPHNTTAITYVRTVLYCTVLYCTVSDRTVQLML